jgi:uncharacterized protein
MNSPIVLLRKIWGMTLLLILLLLPLTASAADIHFPPLTARVVDDAHILSSQTLATLDQKLAEYENGTTNQVVVVTLSSLQGDSIEDYGYKLGRSWGIGHKGKDNGVLLIVAPNEHKVRIEVGYGLEGTLTDAAASEIIQGIILPDFRKGDMERGVADGVDAVLAVLGGKSVTIAQAQQAGGGIVLPFIIFIFFWWMVWRHPFLSALLMSSGNFRYGSSGIGSSWSGGGGGFSGGGGSFGGGGASGSW